MRDTAAVMDSMKQRIEALRPSPQVSEDDVFRVQCEDVEQCSGSRDCRLTALAGRQVFPGKNLTDWETTLRLEVQYDNNPPEQGQPTVTQQAIRDSEAILADLYVWSTVTDGITKFEADMGDVAFIGDGKLAVTRTLHVQFTRG